jgi:hypothetical protein
VVVALLIGSIEGLGLIGDQLGLGGWIWGGVGTLNGDFSGLGFVIIGVFVLARAHIGATTYCLLNMEIERHRHEYPEYFPHRRQMLKLPSPVSAIALAAIGESQRRRADRRATPGRYVLRFLTIEPENHVKV